MEIKNGFIKELYQTKELTEEEVRVLFENKTDYSQEKTKTFNSLLQKVIDLSENTLDLSHIRFLDFDFCDLKFKKTNIISFRMAHFMGKVSCIFTTITHELHFNKTIFDNEIILDGATFSKNISFKEAIFNAKISFVRVQFNENANFEKTTFQESVHFDKSTFEKKTYFKESTFHKYVSFKGVTFRDYANFRKCNFMARATLRGIRSKDLVNFSNSSFYDLDLENTQFSNANYLHISGLNKNSSHKVVPTKEHFTNKESARLIKTHFEKQNNISESNKYFQIEQELYIEHLKKSTTEPNRLPTLTTLYLSKLISNYGTDWIRALLLLFGMGMLFILIYMGLDSHLSTENRDIKHFTSSADILYVALMIFSYLAFYTSTFYKSEKSSFGAFIAIGIAIAGIAIFNYHQAVEIQNYIIQLTNPVNAFKNVNLYEGLEIYGVGVRIVITIIIYQLIVAFRQHTRRK